MGSFLPHWDHLSSLGILFWGHPRGRFYFLATLFGSSLLSWGYFSFLGVISHIFGSFLLVWGHLSLLEVIAPSLGSFLFYWGHPWGRIYFLEVILPPLRSSLLPWGHLFFIEVILAVISPYLRSLHLAWGHPACLYWLGKMFRGPRSPWSVKQQQSSSNVFYFLDCGEARQREQRCPISSHL